MSVLAIEGFEVNAVVGTNDSQRRQGDIGRAFSGKMRSDTRALHREYTVRSGPVDSDDKAALEAILRTPGKVKVGGTEIGDDSYFHISNLVISPLPASFWSFAFVMSESDDAPDAILFSTAGDAPGPYTITRSGSVGKYIDSDGVLQEAAANVLRRTHLYENGEWVPYLLIEDARTNLITDDDLTNWTTGTGTPTVTGSISDPAGGTGAYRVQDNNVGSIENIYLTPSFTGDGVKGFYIVWRDHSVPSSGCTIIVEDQSGPSSRALLNATWTDGVPSINAIVGTHLGTRRLGFDWYITYGQTSSVTAANTHRVYITPAATASDAGSIEVFRVGVFDDAIPSFSILDASETRNADTLYMPYAAAHDQEVTFYYRGIEFGAADESLSTYMHLGDGTDTESQAAFYNNSGTLKFYVEVEQGEDEAGSATAPSYLDDLELRGVIATSGITFGQAENQGTEDTATGSGSYGPPRTSWAGAQMHFGSRGSDRRCPACLVRHAHVFSGDTALAQCRNLGRARLHARIS